METKAKNSSKTGIVLKTKALNVVIKYLIIFVLVGSIVGVGLVAYVNRGSILNKIKSFMGSTEIAEVSLASNVTEIESEDYSVTVNGLTIKVPRTQNVIFNGKSHTVAMEGWDEYRVTRTIKFFKDGNQIDYKEVVNVGTYTAKVTFKSVDDESDAATLDVTLIINPAEIDHTAKFNPEKLNFVYDGSEKHADVLNTDTITGGKYIVKYFKDGELMEKAPIDAGEYTVQLVIGGGNYVLDDSIEETLVIEKATATASELGLSFANKTVTYEYGKVRSNEVQGLSEDMKVTYKYYTANGSEITADKLVTAGTYIVEANIVSKNYKNVVIKSVVIIEKQYLDVSELGFVVDDVAISEADLTFDGKEKNIKVVGLEKLPEDVVVKEIINEKITNAGRYMVEVIFEANTNYEFPAVYDFVVIKKANITGLSVENKEVNYDGKAHTIEVKGELPTGASFVESLKFTEVGQYRVVVKVNGGTNYNDWTGEATLTILNSKVLDVVVNSIQSVTYDGDKHLPIIVADDSLSIKYFVGKDATDGVVNAGEYVIRVVVSDEHYSKEFNVNYTVDKANLSGVAISEAIYVYDSKKHEAVIDQEIAEDITVVKEYYIGSTKLDGAPVNVGTYVVVVTLSGNNYEEYKVFSTITINKATFTASDIVIDKTTHTYDGKAKNVEVTLSEEFTEEIIKRENIVITVSKSVINAGVYEQRYTITAGNYETYTNVVKMTINKAPYELGANIYTDTKFSYNGKSHTVLLNNNILEELKMYGAVVTYIDNTATECGRYVARIIIDSPNYETKDLRVEWEINKGILIDTDNYAKLFADTTVDYNGQVQYIQIKYSMLPKGELSDPAKNKDSIVYRYVLTNGEVFEIIYSGEFGANVDEYVQKVTVRSNNYEDVVCEAKLSIVPIAFNPADFGISFIDKEIVYNGKAHSIFVESDEENIFTVEYKGNGVINVGTYEVVATLKNHNYLDHTMVAKIVVTPANLVLGDMEFNNGAVNYDGQSHTIEAIKVPDGIKVTYTYKNSNGEVIAKEDMVNAGIYMVIAKFEKDNYIPAERQANLTINKIKLVLDSGISVEDVEVTYDGNEHQVKINGLDKLPSDVTYKIDKLYIKAGMYTQKVTFSGSNYTNNVVIEKRLTINKATINVDVKDTKVNYTGKSAEITVVGDIPDQATLFPLPEHTNPGTYQITVKIVGGENYEDYTKTITLTIEDSKVLYANVELIQSVVYDGALHLPSVKNYNSNLVKYLYNGEECNGFVDAGDYDVDVVVSDGFYSKTFHVSFRVEKANMDPESIVITNTEVPYDGKEHGLEFVKVPEGAIIVTGEKKYTDPGTYNIQVRIQKENYNDYYKTVKFVIKDSTVRVVSVPSKQLEGFDFQKHLPAVRNTQGGNITIKYYLNGEEVTEGVCELGTYYFTIEVSDNESGYTRTFETEYVIRLNFMLLPLSVVIAIVTSIIASLAVVLISRQYDFVSQRHFAKASAAINKVRGGIICESYAKSKNKKLRGRLYLTSTTIEFYADDYHNSANCFLINLADVRSVDSKGGNKIVIHANHEAYEFIVPVGTSYDWATEIVRA